MLFKFVKFFCLSFVLLFIISCGGGGSSAGGGPLQTNGNNKQVGSDVLQSVALTPANVINIQVESTHQFAAIGTFLSPNGLTYESDITSAVSWSSESSLIADVNNVGLVTGINPGTTQITVAAGPGIESSALVIIVGATVPVTLKSMTISPESSIISKSSSQQYQVIGYYSNGNSYNITSKVSWTSSSESIVTVNESGLAEALNTGQVQVTAQLDGISATAVLLVKPLTILTAIEISPESSTISTRQYQQYTAQGYYSDGTNRDITTSVAWSSTNESVGVIDITGQLISIESGNTVINARLNGISGTGYLLVQPPNPLEKITINPVLPNIYVGESISFTATGTYEDGSTNPITTSVNWSTESATIATINSNGIAVGNDAGKTNVIAALNGIQTETALTVKKH